MKQINTTVRLVAIGALFIFICAAYLVLLVRVQITGQDYYAIVEESANTRYVSIDAARGEIYDRCGKALGIHRCPACPDLK